MNDEFGSFSYGETKKESSQGQKEAPKKRWTPEPYKESIYAAPNYAKTDYSRQEYLKPSESRFTPAGQQTASGTQSAQPAAGSFYSGAAYTGTQGASASYGTQGSAASYGTQGSAASYGTHGPASTYGTQKSSSPYAGTQPSYSNPVTPAPTPQPEKPEPETAKKKEKREKNDSFGRKVLYTAILGLVFGLIGGGAFIGLNKAFGDSGKDEKTTVSGKTDPGSTETGTTQATLNTGDQIKTQDVVNGDGSSQTINYDVAEIVKKAQPSIVSITTRVTTQYQYFYQQFEQESTGAGSGIIIGESADKLYIATNYHVIEGAKEINVGFNDGQILKAKVTGSDKSNDVAVVEIPLSDIPESTADAISVAVPGDSDALQVGEPAIAIGNALGYGQSVTVGYISALNRSISGNDGSYIQTDAAINPGNSGGALINSKGEVIGINSVKYVDNKVEGMGFSIPINTAMRIIDGIINNGGASGTVYIGISGATINSEYSQIYGFPEGVYVKSVTGGGPAERGGIHEGDIIVSLEGKSVTTMDEFKEMLQNYPSGTEVKLEVYRANSMGRYEKTTVNVVTAEE